MSKLTKYKFSDLYEMSSGISSSKAQSGHGSPFVSFSTVFNNYFLPEELSDLMNTSIKEQEIYSVKKDDVFITRTSETVDALAMSCVATKDYPKATFSGFVKRLRPKTTGIVYSKYIAFFLRSKYFRKVLDCNTIMTLRASFNEDIFSFLYVYLPDYEEQVRIGDLLYKIEMKVRTNNKINDNLEQQMHLIFEDMMAKATNNKIKGEFIVAKSLTQVITGKEDANFSVSNGKYKFFTCSNTPLHCDEYAFNSSSVLIAGNGDFNVKHYSGKFNAYQRTYVLSPQKEYYAILYLAALYRINSFKTGSSGSIVKFITKSDVENIPVFMPHDSKYLDELNKLVIMQEQNMLENELLVQLRDWLLPMLMNSQATISD